MISKNGKFLSPITEAIREAEAGMTAEIRVHISRRFFEKDPYRRAQQLFRHYEMHRTTHRNAILIYVNLRRRKFAILGDEGAHAALGQRCWEELARELKRGFIATHPENAIADIIRKIGQRLAPHFGLEAASEGSE